MVDVLVGNVILTGILALALVLFVASASGLAELYTLHLDESLLTREAVYVGQSLQQLYLTVNSTQSVLPQSVELRLPMPETINGHAYTVNITSSNPQAVDQTYITVTTTLSGSTLSRSVSIIIGRCTILTHNPLNVYPYLTINMTLNLTGAQEACTLTFS